MMKALLLVLEKALGEPVEADTPLLSSGLVEPLRVPELLQALEEHFGIEIDPGEIGVENFDTPEQIAAFAAERV
jgi:acyl carrier protein